MTWFHLKIKKVRCKMETKEEVREEIGITGGVFISAKSKSTI